MVARTALSTTAVLLLTTLACAKKDDGAAADTSTVASSTSTSATSATSAPAANPLDSIAGKWNMTSTPTSGANKSPTKYVLSATSNTSGWTITFPGRPPVPATVTVVGDSVQMKAGPYSSVRRKGVQVTTDGYMRLENGKLTGTTTAHYSVKTADSVLTLRTEGTRAK